LSIANNYASVELLVFSFCLHNYTTMTVDARMYCIGTIYPPVCLFVGL